MSAVEKFLVALAMTESDGSVRAWGDEVKGLPMAFGAFQTHLCWLWQYSGEYGISPGVDESVDAFQRRVIAAFYRARCQVMSPAAIALEFHLGHRGTPADAPVYVARFAENLRRV